ncbi:threonine--tRNA ligase [Candidatus Hodarchaeum mangrovi]
MQLLLIHSHGFAWKINEKAIKDPEPLDEVLGEYSTESSVLIVFISVEVEDTKNRDKVILQGSDEIIHALNDIKETNVIIYPWVHLTKTNPARSSEALEMLRELTTNIKIKNRKLNIIRAPFGYYKSFSINCKGHALAERSKEILGDIDIKSSIEVTKALEAEDQTKSEFFILTEFGEKVNFRDFNYNQHKELDVFVKYETAKDRSISTPPKHVDLMKKLELIDYESGSDSGNFRILPRGFVVKRLIEDQVLKIAAQYGAMIVETPLMYSYEHPSLKKYLERFPARQYVVKSGDKDYFLRFAACFGQFLTLSDALISYRQLPVKIFELAQSFRREQRGELAGIRRLRAFTMPDLHTVALDIDMAKAEFETQFKMAFKYMKDIDITFETAFRMTYDFYEENHDWIKAMVQSLNKPVLLELFNIRYAYFILKFEFNVVDAQKKAAALSTVQIDVENAERFNIKYINDQGQDSYPLLLHCSLSGSTERVIYAILEEQIKRIEKGQKPQFPLWLAPIQVRIIPVTDDLTSYALEISEYLESRGIRIEIDDRDLSLSKKIRAAEKLWTPYVIVIGKKEFEDKTVNVRSRQKKKQETLSLKALEVLIKEQVKDKPIIARVFPKLVSKQPIFTREV